MLNIEKLVHPDWIVPVARKALDSMMQDCSRGIPSMHPMWRPGSSAGDEVDERESEVMKAAINRLKSEHLDEYQHLVGALRPWSGQGSGVDTDLATAQRAFLRVGGWVDAAFQ